MTDRESQFEFASLEGHAQRGYALRLLIRAGKVTAEEVAHKLAIRARILRDIAPAVSRGKLHDLDLPQIRAKNLEWTADELEIAGETIVALANVVSRTAQDEINGTLVEKFRLALLLIQDGPPEGFDGDSGYCMGVATSALAAERELLGEAG